MDSDTTVTMEHNGVRTDVTALLNPQMSFDVGGSLPTHASVKVSGGLPTGSVLKKGRQLYVRVITEDGEIIAEAPAFVGAVAFKDKRDKYGEVESTERIHTVVVA